MARAASGLLRDGSLASQTNVHVSDARTCGPRRAGDRYEPSGLRRAAEDHHLLARFDLGQEAREVRLGFVCGDALHDHQPREAMD